MTDDRVCRSESIERAQQARRAEEAQGRIPAALWGGEGGQQ